MPSNWSTAAAVAVATATATAAAAATATAQQSISTIPVHRHAGGNCAQALLVDTDVDPALAERRKNGRKDGRTDGNLERHPSGLNATHERGDVCSTN